MKTRNFTLCALGLAAAFTFGGAVTASAQATSQTRIPVRKDDPQQQPMKVDTVRIQGRTDTVMVRSRPDTVVRTVDRVRYDTVMQMRPLMPLSRLFLGLGGGVAIPMNNWRNSTKDGPALHAHLGLFPGAGMLGVRFDGDVGLLHRRETDCKTCPNPRYYQGSGNLVLRMPLDRTSKLNPVIYALAGGGVTKFQNFLAYQRNGKLVTAGGDTYVPFTAGVAPGTTGPSIAVTAANRGSGSIFGHGQFGGGLELNVFSNAHLFTEGKYTIIKTNGGNSHTFPVIAGFNFGW